MTLQNAFYALLDALKHNPESNRVDQLLRHIVTHTLARLQHQGSPKGSSIKILCLRITNPDQLSAADQLLRHYGLGLLATRHQNNTYYISIRELPTPTAPSAAARPIERQAA